MEITFLHSNAGHYIEKWLLSHSSVQYTHHHMHTYQRPNNNEEQSINNLKHVQ